MSDRHCVLCQAIQMSSDADLGTMVRLVNAALDREVSRRLALETEHAGCAAKISELEGIVEQQNRRLNRKKAS